jgi:hypothetical protein
MLVPRSLQNVIKLHPDRKNRAVLRSLRPRKLVMQTMDSATRPAVDSATFTNTNRRAVMRNFKTQPRTVNLIK